MVFFNKMLDKSGFRGIGVEISIDVVINSSSKSSLALSYVDSRTVPATEEVNTTF